MSKCTTGTGAHTSIRVHWFKHQNVRNSPYGHGQFVQDFLPRSSNPFLDKIYTATVALTFKKLLANGKLPDNVKQRIKQVDYLNWS